MNQPNGLHHIAISTGDMKKQIEFFSDVLGMELTALYWMHGTEGAWHGFMRLGQGAVAFVFVPGNAEVETRLGETHGGPTGSSAPGTTQHLALNVDTMEDVLALRDRIRSRDIPVMGPIHHGFCSSIYFPGPENLSLEISTSEQAIHPLDLDGTWIDPEVVALAGISDEELLRYRSPPAYEPPEQAVPQPEFDALKLHFTLPEDQFKAMLETPDELITETVSDTVPPGK